MPIRWLIRSRLIGKLQLQDGRVLLTHVLGRARVLACGSAAELLEAFEGPLPDPRVSGSSLTASPKDNGWISEFLKGKILRYAGNDEASAIRSAYRRGVRPRARPIYEIDRLRPTNLPDRRAISPLDFDLPLRLSKSLAILKLSHDEVLATHPTGSVTHVSEALWKIATEFESPNSLAKLQARLGKFGCGPKQIESAVRFLLERKLLWVADRSEQEAGQRFVKLFEASGDAIGVIYPLKERWRQFFLAYDLSTFKTSTRKARIAFIGPCVVQQGIECTEHLGEERGWALECHGFAAADKALRDATWDTVVASVNAFTADLYVALADNDIPRAHDELHAIVSMVNHLLHGIRQYTDAPILMARASRTGMSGFSPFSGARHAEIAVVASLNARLSDVAQAYEQVTLIDEDDLAIECPGVYWDDEHNACAHHSPTSSANWVVLPTQPGEVGAAKECTDEVIPARGGMDPSVYMATLILDFLDLRHQAEPPISAIVIAPDNVLWKGALAAEPFIQAPSPFGDVEDQVYAGMHDALRRLSKRGLRLFARIAEGPDILSRYEIDPSNRSALRPSHFDGIVSGSRWTEAFNEITARFGISPSEILCITANADEIDPQFQGYVFRGPLHAMRRCLLTHSKLRSIQELFPQPFPTESAGQIKGVGQADTLNFGDAAVRSIILASVSRETKRSVRECEAVSDFRLIGLDSLAVATLAADIERDLGVTLTEEDLTEAVVFRLPALAAAVQKRLYARPTIKIALSAPVGANASGLGLKDTIRSNLLGATQPWQLKTLEYAAPQRYQYMKGGELLEHSETLIRLLQAHRVPLGERMLVGLFQEAHQAIGIVSGVLSDLSLLVLTQLKNETMPTTIRRIGEICELHSIRVVLFDASRCDLAQLKMAARNWHALVVAIDNKNTWTVLADSRRESPSADPVPRLMLLTSGSTGNRKLVTHPLSVIEYQAKQLGAAFGIRPDSDRMLSWTPLHHAMGMVPGFLLPLMWGIPLIRMSSQLWTIRPRTLFQELFEERGTLTFMPNFALAHCVHRVSDESLVGIDLSHVRAIVSSGEAVGAHTMRDFRAKFSRFGLSGDSVLASYGMTEVGGCITLVRPVDRTTEGDSRHLYGVQVGNAAPSFVSSGPPIEGSTVLVDHEEGTDMGELLVHTPATHPESGVPESRFVKKGSQWLLRTGDMGFVRGGEVFVIGRSDDMIKRSGQLLDPAEIESRLMQCLSEGGDAVVTSVDDEQRGTQRLVIIIEEGAHTITDQKVSETLLTEMGLIADVIRVVPKGWIVHTVSGKKSRKLTKAKLLNEGLTVQ